MEPANHRGTRPARIIVTRAPERLAGVARAFGEHGLEAIALPLLTIVAVDGDERARIASEIAADKVAGFWVFTSAHAADVVAALWVGCGQPATPAVYAVGAATRAALERVGMRVAWSGAGGADELVRVLRQHARRGQVVRFFAGDRALETISSGLSDLLAVTTETVYRSLARAPGDPALTEALARWQAQGACGIAFFSPSQVEILLGHSAGMRQQIEQLACIATIGSTTARAAERARLRVDVVAHPATAEALAQGMADFLFAAEPRQK